MTKKCPTCGYDNRDDALLCNLCGMIFKKAATARAATSEEPNQDGPAPASSVPAPPTEPSPVVATTAPTAAPEAEPSAGTALEWNDRGAALFSQKKLDEALACFEKALALDSRFVKALGNKANSLFQLGYQQEGLQLQDKALALAPLAAETWLNKAAMEKLMGRGAEALRSLQELESLAGTSHQDLVSSARRMAEELEASGIQPAPRSGLGWLAEGARQAQSRDLQQAKVCFERALALDPRLATAWRLKGDCLLQSAGPAEALVCYNAGLDSDSEDPLLWHSKGVALAKLRRFEEALTAFERGVELRPQMAAGWSDRGKTLCALGRLEEAVQFLEKAITLEPKAATVWLTKALAEDRLKRESDAARSYQRFLDLAPADMKPQIHAARDRVVALSAPSGV